MQWTINDASLAARRIITLIAIAISVSTVCAAQNVRRMPKLAQKLERRVTATWQEQELSIVLDRLAEAGELDIWLDRRVDRQRKVSIQIANQSMRQALASITDQHALGFAQLGELLCIGPQQPASELKALVHQARQSVQEKPTQLRRRWLRSGSVEWPRLSEPRKLVESWLDTAGLQLDGAEKISHDLWPAQALPTLPLIERLVIVLSGFDLTCQISPDGQTAKIVPIERPVKISSNSVSAPNKSRMHALPKKKTTYSRQLFTLRLQNQPLGRVLDRFAEQLDLEIVWPQSTEKALRERLVSCDVNKVELEELFHAILQPIDLQHRKLGTRVTIEPI